MTQLLSAKEFAKQAFQAQETYTKLSSEIKEYLSEYAANYCLKIISNVINSKISKLKSSPGLIKKAGDEIPFEIKIKFSPKDLNILEKQVYLLFQDNEEVVDYIFHFDKTLDSLFYRKMRKILEDLGYVDINFYTKEPELTGSPKTYIIVFKFKAIKKYFEIFAGKENILLDEKNDNTTF